MVTRIRQLLEHKQLTPTQFADLIGVGRPVMSHILSERNKPSLEVAQRIGSAFPDVSLSWLMFGAGQMLAAEAASPFPAPAAVSEPTATESASELPLAPPSLVEVAPPTTSNTVPTPSAPVPVDVTPSTAPVRPLEALPRPFSISQPAPAPMPVAPPAVSPILVPAPVASSEPTAPLEVASSVVPVMPQPFRAARFVPTAQAAPVPALATDTTVPPAVPVAGPELVATPPPALSASVPPLGSDTTAVSAVASNEAAMLPFLAESGKAIRRIVIFYRDGSFADYQPE